MNIERFAYLRVRAATAPLCLVLLGLVAACADSGSGTSLNDAPLAREAAPSSKDFGDYVLHFNAVTSDLVSPEDAAKYGISRSRSNALLNVVILKKTGEPAAVPISGDVSAKSSNLTGQLKKVDLRKIAEGDSIYYIGVIPVANNETLNFEITARPEGSNEPLVVKFQQQFFTK